VSRRPAGLDIFFGNALLFFVSAMLAIGRRIGWIVPESLSRAVSHVSVLGLQKLHPEGKEMWA
jgi:hypothetical protein